MSTDPVLTGHATADATVAGRPVGQGQQEATVGLLLLALGLVMSAACSVVAEAVGADSPAVLLFVNLVLMVGGVATACVGLVHHLVED